MDMNCAKFFGLLRLYEFMLCTTMKKKQSWENKSRMLIQNLFQLIVTDYSAMHCYYSCGLPNCLTSKVSKLAQNWGSKWPWYAIIVIFLHYWRAIFFCSLTRQEVFLVCDLLEKIMLPTKNVAASLGSTKVNRAKTLIVTPNYVLPLVLNLLLLPLVLNLFCKQYLSILDN